MPSHASVVQATEQYDIGSVNFARNDPDASLVAAARCGDAGSIETLIQRRRAKVLRLAESITRNHADAEEVAQNALFLAFRRLNSFQGESLFATWLARIAINQSLAALRKRRQRDISLELVTEGALSRESIATERRVLSPEESLSQRETRAVVVEAVGRLKPAFRTAIEVHYFREKSTEETAQILQLSAQALKARLHRARAKLRETLKHHLALGTASPAL
jgi:RNA polymerase sigma-70 factor (ECF subfamily)